MRNSKKYGDPKTDVIAQMFAISYEHGEGFCKCNILKYITRYNKVAQMGLFDRLRHKLNGKGNRSDLIKANDYFQRLDNNTPMYKDFRPLKKWYYSLQNKTK